MNKDLHATEVLVKSAKNMAVIYPECSDYPATWDEVMNKHKQENEAIEGEIVE